ncbi:glycosyl transferase [Microbacterium pumilum]|uniref:GDP-mannose--glycolipid 4-beta-D-mannosyltransferase n=1 Tax=Microbacterium pumilum TaxID=344165 RepID=A0ABN2SBC2_9MICO
MITVMQSTSAPDGTTKYVDQLLHEQPSDLRFLFFSWDAALKADYDVFHVHWPDALLTGSSAPRRWLNRIRFARLLRRLKAHGIPIVRTLHNVHPHEGASAIDRRLLQRLDAQTAFFVRINRVTELPAGRPGATILHGHYVDRFGAHPRAEMLSSRVLNFGLMRRYKGVDRLIDVFEEWNDSAASLRLVGRVVEADLGRTILEAVDRDPRITAILRFVDDDELVQEVTAAEIVVLPYSEMHNSGTLLVTLSLGRPALVPRSEVNEAIAQEVGPGWVLQYDGSLELEHIQAALLAARARSAGAPDLAERDWKRVTDAYSDVFRDVVSADRRLADSAHRAG